MTRRAELCLPPGIPCVRELPARAASLTHRHVFLYIRSNLLPGTTASGLNVKLVSLSRSFAMRFAFFGFLFLTSAAASQTCNGPGKERWPVKKALPASPSRHHAAKFALNDLLALSEPPNVQHND